MAQTHDSVVKSEGAALVVNRKRKPMAFDCHAVASDDQVVRYWDDSSAYYCIVDP